MVKAYEAAVDSPDPSTQNGAVIVSVDELWDVTACNQFPRGVGYSDERWERPAKYAFIEHAERNAIFEATYEGVSLNGATLIAAWAACADCARAIVQAGISTLVRHNNPSHPDHDAWQESIAIGDTIMREGGVQIIEIEKVSAPHIQILRNGELFSPCS